MTVLTSVRYRQNSMNCLRTHIHVPILIDRLNRSCAGMLQIVRDPLLFALYTSTYRQYHHVQSMTWSKDSSRCRFSVTLTTSGSVEGAILRTPTQPPCQPSPAPELWRFQDRQIAGTNEAISAGTGASICNVEPSIRGKIKRRHEGLVS